MSQGPISPLYVIVMALQISWEYTTKRKSHRATGETARSEGRRMRWQNLEAVACEVSAWHTETKTNLYQRADWAFGDDGNTLGIDRLAKLLSLILLEGYSFWHLKEIFVNLSSSQSQVCGLSVLCSWKRMKTIVGERYRSNTPISWLHCKHVLRCVIYRFHIG